MCLFVWNVRHVLIKLTARVRVEKIKRVVRYIIPYKFSFHPFPSSTFFPLLPLPPPLFYYPRSLPPVSTTTHFLLTPTSLPLSMWWEDGYIKWSSVAVKSLLVCSSWRNNGILQADYEVHRPLRWKKNWFHKVIAVRINKYDNLYAWQYDSPNGWHCVPHLERYL